MPDNPNSLVNSRSPNFAGRRELIRSLDLFWPQLRNSLWVRLVQGAKHSKETALRKGFSSWCLEFNILDQWLQESYWESVYIPHANADFAHPPPPLYFPNETVVPVFAPPLCNPPRPKVELVPFASAGNVRLDRLNDIYGSSLEPASQFKSRMLDDFKKQLDEYISDVYTHRFSSRKGMLALHSDWTALRMSGKTYSSITETNLYQAKKFEPYDLDVVKVSVSRFRKEIGLTLKSRRK